MSIKLHRLLASVLSHQHSVSQRRTYSFFSSQGNGGNGSSSKSRHLAGGNVKGKVVAVEIERDDKVTAGGVAAAASAGSAVLSKPSAATAPTPTATISERLTFAEHDTIAPLAPPPPHPELTPQSLSLHNFLSLHRPLLQIHNPPPSLFASSSSSTQYHEQEDEAEEDEAESFHSQLSFLLSTSLLTSSLVPKLAFNSALARLGSVEDKSLETAIEEAYVAGQEKIRMDSTKRKKSKKMSRHKLKKRRRLLRQQKHGGSKK